MVNFRDPDVIESEIRTSHPSAFVLEPGKPTRGPVLGRLLLGILLGFWHAVDGLYIWEFITTLDYELGVIRGRRPYRRSIWIYSFTRIVTLVAVILNVVSIDIATPVNCQVLVTFELVFAYLAFAAASLLIVLRNVAIWKQNKIIVALAAGVWGANIAFLIRGIVRLRTEWVPEQKSCVVLNPLSNKLNVIATLVTDITLLLIMLIGLLRLGTHASDAFGVGRLLWKQGVIWLFLATIAEVTPVVFISLDLNDVFNLIFQTPAVIIMSIAATRMHRSLADYIHEPTDIDNLKNCGRRVSSTRQNCITRASYNRMGMVGHTAYAQYPTSQASHDGSTIVIDGQLSDGSQRSSLDSDVESGVKHWVQR